MKKKLLMVLAVVTVLGLAGCQNNKNQDESFKESAGVPDGDDSVLTEPTSIPETDAGAFVWKVNDDGITITGLSEEGKTIQDIVIPEMIDGKPVTEIGFEAFKGQTNLKNIVLPDAITILGNKAFYECSRLKSVRLPKNLTYLGDSAFNYCYELLSVELPEGLNEVGQCAFSSCSKMETLILPNSITWIGKEAFSYCTSLKNVVVPERVMEIGLSAFAGCTNLETVDLPRSLRAIGVWAFKGCDSMKSITVRSGENYFSHTPNGNFLQYIFTDLPKSTVFILPRNCSPTDSWLTDKGYAVQYLE